MNGMSVFDVDTSEEVCATLFHQFDELNNNEYGYNYFGDIEFYLDNIYFNIKYP